MTKILLIEDDQKAARLLKRGLQEEDFAVDAVHSAEDGEPAALTGNYDLIVLDWMLPAKDGITLCGELRARGLTTPILMLTARDGLGDRIAGLDTGADDYLTKPFAFDELLARIRALLRRSTLTQPPQLKVADLTLEPQSHVVKRAGQVLDLTPKEYAILELLMRQAGHVVSRQQLAERIWTADLIAIDNLMDAHMRNLRRKLDPVGMPRLIHTVRGQGFRLAEAADDDA
ncbi:response regulator transcription factor [Rugamonas aquatica]|uniref:Response regulator n=1 Tax=Rugamonas aquatica TaxID=2743357 RepID=A0A6A7N894_9BURK|nr:response regulator transcription factor [Rugamonas aquatica]MQA40967.1 response regulator [Rugamonas aquatica]